VTSEESPKRGNRGEHIAERRNYRKSEVALGSTYEREPWLEP
jgi:hypothetical protein